MIIVLTELLHTEKTVHLAGLLFSVKNIVLGITNRQFLIGTISSLVGEHRIWTVHRLCRHGVDIFTVINYRARLNLHRLFSKAFIGRVLEHSGEVRIGF